MSRDPGDPPRWLHRCRAGLFVVLVSCGQLPPTSSVVIPPVPAGAGRVWVYRNDYQYEADETPYVRLNGQIAGIIQPNGVFYRDVAPGYYTVAVDSYGAPYPHQFAEFNLGAGQEAFVKVLSMREKVGGSEGAGLRTLFFTQLFPADAARAAIAGTPFYGGT
ncbi:MAG TPA: DUF2846 domain-containing protein [Stellaceae bacterium]|jgi:hypothetical protein|nr:DUF2846 domain-containing protein [Stellaceae bacterium]